MAGFEEGGREAFLCIARKPSNVGNLWKLRTTPQPPVKKEMVTSVLQPEVLQSCQ